MITIPAQAAHVVPLLARLSPTDVLLINARSRTGATLELIASLQASSLTWCGLDDAGPVTMGGVIPQGCDGMVWQAATPALALHKRAYLRQGWDMLHEMRHFRRLSLDIRASYGAALRHARRLGFMPVSGFDFLGVPTIRCERVQ